mgnify:CR=1 FL=1
MSGERPQYGASTGGDVPVCPRHPDRPAYVTCQRCGRPTCPQCQGDPAFLAKNTGVVAALSGPDGGEPTTFGETASFAVLKDAATDDAKKLVEYLMTDGYRDWLAIAPEGKVPVRSGTKDNPQEYAEAWRALDVGVDTKAPLSEFYDAETLKVVQDSPRSFSRWGFTQGKGELAGAVAGPEQKGVLEVGERQSRPGAGEGRVHVDGAAEQGVRGVDVPYSQRVMRSAV